ncbi:MAG: M48 family metallopeptidase [Pseudomonadota bacterium]
MTALDDYAKLEAEARYFDGQSAAPIEVILSFGERSLVIMGLDDRALAHWPLASLRALGDAGEKTVQLVPDPASDERVVLDDAEMIRAIKAVCRDLYEKKADRRGVKRVMVWGAAAAASVALIVFVLVPALADRLADYVPPERERALGDSIAGQLAALMGQVDDTNPGLCVAPEGLEALAAMTERLAPDGGGLTQPLPYPLRVSVLDHKMVNAVALPGGRILLFRGLIERAGSPEEVAGVLAHEIGHVVHKDPTRGVLRAAGTAGIIGVVLGDVFGASVAAAASDAVLNARHQREAERLADEIAYDILGHAGLPTRPFAAFFDTLHAEVGDTAGPLRYIASHPELSGRADRAAAADRIGSGTFNPVLDDRAWLALQNICDETRPL